MSTRVSLNISIKLGKGIKLEAFGAFYRVFFSEQV